VLNEHQICNFFQNHIQNFAITTAPPFKLTCQDSGYLPGLLPKLAYESFQTLQNHLGDEPTLAFPRADQAYILVTNAFTPNLTLPGGLCKTLVQIGAKGETHIILHTSMPLKENKKNSSPFLLRAAAT
jgi:hypothetical protein